MARKRETGVLFEAIELEGSLPALEELVVVEDRLRRVVDAVKAALCAGSAVHDGETGVPCRDRAYANQLPGCAVRTVSPAMLSRKCSGRRRSQTASEACTRARY